MGDVIWNERLMRYTIIVIVGIRSVRRYCSSPQTVGMTWLICGERLISRELFISYVFTYTCLSAKANGKIRIISIEIEHQNKIQRKLEEKESKSVTKKRRKNHKKRSILLSTKHFHFSFSSCPVQWKDERIDPGYV